MNAQAFDSIIGYLGAFSCVTFALALWFHPYRQRLHIFLGAVLVSLAAALCCRSLAWQYSNVSLMSTTYFFFSIFPLFLILFIERLVSQNLSPKFKIAFIAALLFFTITCWFRPIRIETEWKIAFMIYHVISLSYLLIVLHRFRASGNLSKQEKNVYRAIFYCTGLGLLLLICEWLYAIGPLGGEHVRLSAFAALIFVHALVNIYANENEFTFLGEVKCLGAFLVFSLLGSQILSTVGNDYSSNHLFATMGLLYACTLAFVSLYTQWIVATGSGLSRQIFKLVALDKKTVPVFVRSLTTLTELRSISVATRADVSEHDCTEVYAAISPGVVLTRAALRQELLEENLSPQRKDALEATHYLLCAKGADGVTAIGDSGDLLLASPLAMRSIFHFQSLMLWAAENLAFLYKRQAETQPMFPLKPSVTTPPPEEKL